LAEKLKEKLKKESIDCVNSAISIQRKTDRLSPGGCAPINAIRAIGAILAHVDLTSITVRVSRKHFVASAYRAPNSKRKDASDFVLLPFHMRFEFDSLSRKTSFVTRK